MKVLSVIIPFFNEGENIRRIVDELNAIRRGVLAKYGFEIVLMDNHSTDDSFAIASELAEGDAAIRVIRLSRNFGYQANILTGLLASTGDAVVQLDADGEDDPALIPELVRHWEAGQRVVYGVRRHRAESFFLTLQRKFFYRLLGFLSSVPIPVDAGDFRLMDRCVIEALRGFRESNPYLRGLIAYMGFSQVGVPYDRRPRFAGESKFNWWGYLELAWDGITSFSRKPLTLVVWLGLGLSLLSFGGALFYLGLYLTGAVVQPGFTTLVLLQLFLAGIQLVCIGVIGTYMGRVFDEVKSRPRSIIETEVIPIGRKKAVGE